MYSRLNPKEAAKKQRQCTGGIRNAARSRFIFRLTLTCLFLQPCDLLCLFQGLTFKQRKPANADVYGLFQTPRVGLEPTTPRLTAVCSTIELSRIIMRLAQIYKPFFCILKSKETLTILYSIVSYIASVFSCTFKTAYKKPYSLNLLTFHLSLPIHLWSYPRPISCGQLHTLLHFHLRPIYLVVFKGSYCLTAGISHLEGGFTLRCLQRLSLPGLATLP